MGNGFSNESMLEIYIYETTQNIEQLEEAILSGEKASCFALDTVNQIFRIMHTIKGSSAMMMYNNISLLSHSMEDLFYFIREEKPENMDCALLSDLVLEGVDFIKLELEKVKNADHLDGNPAGLIEHIGKFLSAIKGEKGGADSPGKKQAAPGPQQYYLAPGKSGGKIELKCYEAVIYFEDGCEMENIRAFSIIHNLKEIAEDFRCFPEDIIENNESVRVIREQGFRITLRSNKSFGDLQDFFTGTAFIRDLELRERPDGSGQFARPREMKIEQSPVQRPSLRDHRDPGERGEPGQAESRGLQQGMISVDVLKLDKLMDLMGEMVIAEAMVTQNPELKELQLNSFHKAARQLQKITGELQDMVMSIRMVPLAATFRKMQRIVRDMGRKLHKEVELILIGEHTEVDKKIIEQISDPLMHLVRNAVDHGIETPEERIAAGKRKAGQVILEAKNAGSEVLVIVRDDGRGLDKEKILQKALDAGLLGKLEREMTDKEIYNLIFLPGFSTNDQVTEFSGRGVGMDVVTKNLEAAGGSVSTDSTEGAGTATTLKIPLTLAIIDGMNIRVGRAKYTLPTTSIQETFRARKKDLVKDPHGNEMIMVRGECYPILRLHELFAAETEVTDLTRGIMLMIGQDGRSLCLFADELLGQQQVVVKALPAYMKNIGRLEGLAGCTLLGDGSISLILNISGLVSL
ncbi:CheA signal transduction histidine kinase [Syntrophobotulus glycolicus DSM 8271]|uniref:Chemotaxis protein CheA n=1 Tax=Syntrophobotulus glycolicus (strain DSM 8271 / FlGlyR) TaxID=645991 RepID=F0SUK0_SYNGF|nr:chemotaxis protein CheA [Syntrophobotulus glycolicus]ADY55493.1 CheA signal transduction histidine kinase [Syntrophobotulus glycolicus DSM 8271]